MFRSSKPTMVANYTTFPGPIWSLQTMNEPSENWRWVQEHYFQHLILSLVGLDHGVGSWAIV